MRYYISSYLCNRSHSHEGFYQKREHVRIPAVILLGMWGAFESILGIFQVLHIRPSGNPLFCMTGTFSNPGPFGGGIAIVAAIMIALLVKKKLRSAFVVLILCILVLPASMSRAAWMALAVAMVVLPAGHYKENGFREVFSEGYELFQDGHYEESLETLEKGAALSCDPMFHVIMGRDLEALGKYEAAEREYIHASYMVPCRLYPKISLMRMYVATGRNEEAISIARDIDASAVNPRHQSMLELQQAARTTLDSLLNVQLCLPN